jgi:hypothetical protein
MSNAILPSFAHGGWDIPSDYLQIPNLHAATADLRGIADQGVPAACGNVTVEVRVTPIMVHKDALIQALKSAAARDELVQAIKSAKRDGFLR